MLLGDPWCSSGPSPLDPILNVFITWLLLRPDTLDVITVETARKISLPKHFSLLLKVSIGRGEET